jgi:hypothetical protein
MNASALGALAIENLLAGTVRPWPQKFSRKLEKSFTRRNALNV